MIMRTVARAPRLRRNGSGPPKCSVGSVEIAGDTVAVVGDSVETRVPYEDWTAGNPIMVFFFGGLEDTGAFAPDAGGGVTMGGGGVAVGATKPCDDSRLGLEYAAGSPLTLFVCTPGGGVTNVGS
jgi:hypothetical protein